MRAGGVGARDRPSFPQCAGTRNDHAVLPWRAVATWPGCVIRRPSREGDGGRYGTPVTLHRR